MKLSKLNIFYMIASYFMLFAFVGALFNVLVPAIAWSISIFIILWCAYWFIIYCIDMYYFSVALMEQIDEDLKELKKLLNKNKENK